MYRTYDPRASRLRFACASTKFLVLAGLASAFGLVIRFGYSGLVNTAAGVPILCALVQLVGRISVVLLACAAAALVAAVAVHFLQSDCSQISCMVRRGLFCPAYGNPLHLADGEILPEIRCMKTKKTGQYAIWLTLGAVRPESFLKAADSISSSLNKRFRRYAVVQLEIEEAMNEVHVWVEDVLTDKSLTINTVAEMRPTEPTKLRVQDGTDIDLTTSGSMLVAGKTRSGKTTGIIALLLQVLLAGRDEYGSEVIIIDPKRAELSRLPHVIVPDEDGEATEILEALKRFESAMVKRQKVLNDHSEEHGDAVKWWEAGFHPSFLFADEYVALRSLFPSKAAKDSDYCLATFDAILKRIITMGASAGCFVIISIAEASVESGGLPAMLRSAMSTRVLFRPTKNEARLLWEAIKLENFPPSRVYRAGDAWFSCTDGEHDNVSVVHFPRMKFRVYQELGRLLQLYYVDKDEEPAPPPAEA